MSDEKTKPNSSSGNKEVDTPKEVVIPTMPIKQQYSNENKNMEKR